MNYIHRVAELAPRRLLPVSSQLLDPTEASRVVRSYKEALPRISTVSGGELPFLSEELPSMPVCAILDDLGTPIHPPSVNNSRGRVCVTRQFGGVPNPPYGFQRLTEVLGVDVLQVKQVYTGGTWKGFAHRLELQMTRPTKSIFHTYRATFGSQVNKRKALRDLSKWMPRRPVVDWPNMNDDLTPLLEKIKVNASASAGAPYWQKKGECLSNILETALPIVIKTLKSGSLGRLYKEQPEMFLCEVKNKLDRYDRTRLEEKTRPYVCAPAHFSLLFSILSQRFQEGLVVFDADFSSSNAYGFSSARGGLARFYNWMTTLDEGEVRVVCYGDDSCLVAKRRGKIFRVDPDFKQMDGSIDPEDVDLTITYLLECLEGDGEKLSPFWHSIADLWRQMSVDPLFVVSGTKIYRKKTPSGLMTGIPGTTLFDTVKSVMSWRLYISWCQLGGRDVLAEQNARAFMRDHCGLIIKEGTFNPVEVPLTPTSGTTITDHKFLGVQILYLETALGPVFAPTVPYEDALEALVVQKDSPFERRASHLSSARTIYDRMRGLYLTFGFTIPHIESAIHHVVNGLPPEAILIQTQLPRGEPPSHVTLEDYEFPDSSGFPSREFCYSLYGGYEEQGWTQLFPTLTNLHQTTVEDRLCRLAIRDQKVVAEPETVQMPDLGSVAFTNYQPPPARNVKPNPRSHIEQGSILPNLDVSLRRYLAVRGVASVKEVLDKFSISLTKLQTVVARAGLYLSGNSPTSMVSIRPIQTPQPTIQESLRERGPLSTIELSPINTQPSGLWISPGLPSLLKERRPVGELLTGLAHTFQANGMNMSWKTVGSSIEGTTVALTLAGQKDALARCTAPNSQLAKEYLSREILEGLGVYLPMSKFTVKTPTGNIVSWDEEVEFEDFRKQLPPEDPDLPYIMLAAEIMVEEGFSFAQAFPRLCAVWAPGADPEMGENYITLVSEELSRPPPSKKGRNARTRERRKRQKLQQNLPSLLSLYGEPSAPNLQFTEPTQSTSAQWHPPVLQQPPPRQPSSSEAEGPPEK